MKVGAVFLSASSLLVLTLTTTDALYWFEQALSRDPHKSHLYFNKGLALEYLKRYQESIACFDLSIKYDPNNIENYYEKVMIVFLCMCMCE